MASDRPSFEKDMGNFMVKIGLSPGEAPVAGNQD
jgi:hypothetical protein